MANGSRADSSGVFIDGINDESPRDAGSQISPPLDSIQEFKMETSGYTAQYGRLSGSVVNMVTKSGGNRFHGSLFEFVRNDLFDAPPYNFTNVSVPKTKLRKNQFGGDLSGPVTIPHVYSGRDRTFFQLSLESLRSVTGTSATGLVPTDLERYGRLQSVRSRWHPILLSQSEGEHQGVVRTARAARCADACSGRRLFVPRSLRQNPQHRLRGEEPARLLSARQSDCGPRQP